MFAAQPRRKGLVNAARETCHFQSKVARNLQRYLAESIARAVHAPGIWDICTPSAGAFEPIVRRSELLCWFHRDRCAYRCGGSRFAIGRRRPRAGARLWRAFGAGAGVSALAAALLTMSLPEASPSQLLQVAKQVLSELR
jgi:hypothetical protein